MIFSSVSPFGMRGWRSLSTTISNVTVYKNGDGSQRIREKSPGETNSSPPFIDSRLAEFFNSVKSGSVSKK